MTKRTYQERQQFIYRCVKNAVNRSAVNGPAAARLAELIMRDAATLNRYAEIACSVALDDAGTARMEKRVAAAERRIKERCALLGIKRVGFYGDPRGYVVKVFFDDGAYNTWGGQETGYGVPCTTR